MPLSENMNELPSNHSIPSISTVHAPDTAKKLANNPEVQTLLQKVETRSLGGSVEQQKYVDALIQKSIAKLSGTMSQRFATQKMHFDMAGFESKMRSSIASVSGNPDIPVVVKMKFMEDISKKLELLSDIQPSDVSNFRIRRAIESLGVEPLELQMKFGNNESQKEAYFLQKILTETIGKYIEPAVLGLQESFSTEKQIQLSTGSFHRETFASTQTSLRALDAKYGFDFANGVTVEGFLNGQGGGREKFLEQIQAGLLQKHPNGIFLGQMMKNGVVSPAIRKGAEIELHGKKINVVDAFLEYKNTILQGRGKESEIRETRNIASNTGLSSEIKKVVGSEQLKSEFSYLKSGAIEGKIKSASIADMVIMGTQLAQMAPLIGDIGGGFDGLANALGGMNIDGAKISAIERSLNGVFGVLGVAVVGGWLNRARKSAKFAEIIQSFSDIKKYLPEKIESLLLTGQKVSKETATQL